MAKTVQHRAVSRHRSSLTHRLSLQDKLPLITPRHELRQARLKCGMTQRILGVRAEISQSRISAFECGFYEPTGTEKIQIAAVLNVDPEKIWGATEQSPNTSEDVG